MPRVSPHIFREYDVRGLVDRDLTPDAVELLGRGFAAYLERHGAKTVSLGGDARPSTDVYRRILTGAFTSCGISVVDIGTVPTPVSYFSLFHLPVDGGVMITGSHNPPEFNGFKLALGRTTIWGEEIRKVRDLIEEGTFPSGKGTARAEDIVPAYREHIRSRIRLARPLKVVVDAGNGMGAQFAPALLRDLGAEVVELYCTVDGTFPNHHPDPTVLENLEDLIRTVRAEKADLGIAYDGDADRIGAVDETGAPLWGDQLLALFAREVLVRGGAAAGAGALAGSAVAGAKTPIVFEVKCSQSLVDDIRAHGGEPVMWKTGHSLLKQKMKETGAPLAGEMSGHLFFADEYFGYDDAIYASARLLRLVAATGRTLSSHRESLPKYVSTPEIRIDLPTDEKKFEVAERARAYFTEKYECVTIDGVRILFGDGWGLVRASNTQPVLVVRFEAKTGARLREIQDLVMGKLRELGA